MPTIPKDTLDYELKQQVLRIIAGNPPGAPAWGTIIGTLANQTDLSAALALKVDESQISSFGLTLVNDANAAAARATLGMGSAATEASSAFAAAAHTHAQSEVTSLVSDLALKAPLASPTLTGIPAAPTAAGGTNTTQIATTQFVQTAIADVIASAPGALDTLDELAAALGDDANFAASVTASLAGKQPIDAGLSAIAALGATVGLIEKTATDTYIERAIGVAAGASIPTRADADARYDAAGAAAAAQAASQPLNGELTAIAALSTTAYGRALLALLDAAALTALLNVATSALQGLVPASGGGTANFLRADMTFAAPTASVAATTVEQSLGSVPAWCGRFTITNAGIGPTSKVLCWQAPGPYTGKGTLADEAMLQPVSVVAVAPGSGSAVVHWETPPVFVASPIVPDGRQNTATAIQNQAPQAFCVTRRGKVGGNVKFTYAIFA